MRTHATNTWRRIVILGAVISLVIVALQPGSSASKQVGFKVTTVFLVRHANRADEPRQDPPLNDKGVSRSHELARLLGSSGIKAIYTSQFLRTKQTAEPLARLLGVTVTPMTLKSNPTNPRLVSEQSTTEIIEKILARPGETSLVIGHSNSVPDVIKMLGGDMVPVIDEKKFDDLFVVAVYAKGKAKVVHMKYGSAE